VPHRHLKGHMQAIKDYINGNLADAKKRAKQAGRKRTLEALQDYGYSPETTEAILAYLLDGGSFQAACDAEYADKQKAIQ
jgi:hypothetical protein